MIKSIVFLAAALVTLPAVSADEYDYGSHNAGLFSINVTLCNDKIPLIIDAMQSGGDADLATGVLIHREVVNGNAAAKSAFQKGLKLKNMPSKIDIDKCYTHLAEMLEIANSKY